MSFLDVKLSNYNNVSAFSRCKTFPLQQCGCINWAVTPSEGHCKDEHLHWAYSSDVNSNCSDADVTNCEVALHRQERADTCRYHIVTS